MQVIKIDKRGAVSFVHDEQIAKGFAGEYRKRRASVIEPTNAMLCWFFRLIRNRVSDDSILAAWTRRWPCAWRARILNGPELATYKTRSEAIAAERRWLNDNGFRE